MVYKETTLRQRPVRVYFYLMTALGHVNWVTPDSQLAILLIGGQKETGDSLKSASPLIPLRKIRIKVKI